LSQDTRLTLAILTAMYFALMWLRGAAREKEYRKALSIWHANNLKCIARIDEMTNLLAERNKLNGR
jgi:hypothetical protein